MSRREVLERDMDTPADDMDTAWMGDHVQVARAELRPLWDIYDALEPLAADLLCSQEPRPGSSIDKLCKALAAYREGVDDMFGRGKKTP